MSILLGYFFAITVERRYEPWSCDGATSLRARTNNSDINSQTLSSQIFKGISLS